VYLFLCFVDLWGFGEGEKGIGEAWEAVSAQVFG
jgi:hypothetical protein